MIHPPPPPDPHSDPEDPMDMPHPSERDDVDAMRLEPWNRPDIDALRDGITRLLVYLEELRDDDPYFAPGCAVAIAGIRALPRRLP